MYMVNSLAAATIFFVAFVEAQRPPPNMRGRPCADQGLERCPMIAPFENVTIWADDQYRYIQTTGCPPYAETWTNPNEACVFDTTFRVPLVPRYSSTPIPVGEIQESYNGINYLREDPMPILGSLGVYVNGVYIFGIGSPCGAGSECPNGEDTGAPSQYVDAVQSEGRSLDGCDGHASGFNQYHIHSGESVDRNDQRLACGLPTDNQGEHSALLGWMFDGFAIYGMRSLGGELPTDLDECGGHIHEIDGEMTYHYHFPNQFPWTIGCFTGCPEVSNNDRQLSFANNGSYGCPQGLSEKPISMTDGALQLIANILHIMIPMVVLVIMIMWN